MPLPIGHAVIGFTTQRIFSAEESGCRGWKAVLGVLILSNFPDVDVLLGIVFQGNGNVFHRGPTHSLLFAFIGGLLAAGILGGRLHLPKFSFRMCFLLILSHVLADLVFTVSPVSFFWPFTVNWSSGTIELKHVVNLILFENYRDMEIIIGCVFVILLHRTLAKSGVSACERFAAMFWEETGARFLKRLKLLLRV